MKFTHLPLKRCFWDPILSGHKEWEFRSKTKYYDKIFANPPNFLIFHAYRSDFIIARVEKVRIVDRPPLAGTLSTDECYAIKLAEPMYFNNKLEAKELFDGINPLQA